MKTLRSPLTLCAALAAFSGCGGSQLAIGEPGAMPPTSVVGQHVAHGKSWVLPEAKRETLIYAASGCGGSCVFSYPNGKLVGTIGQYGDGICADENGNVFLTFETTVTEYAHGGTTPIATLNLPGNSADGCAVDPITGNLAVVFRTNGADVAIFSKATGTPTLYASQVNSRYCGYDNQGNLFVNGYDGQAPGISELLSGQGTFTKLAIDSSVGNPAQVQWDGQYMTWESGASDQVVISQLSLVGSTFNIVGTTKFSGIGKIAAPSWIFGNRVAVPWADRGTRAKKIGIWPYPQGGNIVRGIKGKNTNNLQGVAVSVAPSR